MSQPAENRPWGAPILARTGLALAAAALLLGVVAARAQEEPPPEEKPPEKKGGTLRDRPDDDPAAQQFVNSLNLPRPQMAGVAAAPVIRHVLSPDGSYLYYFRDLNAGPSKPAEKREPAKPPAKPRYVLYRASPQGGEEKILETGFDAIAPLFLPDGGLVVVTRTLDLNGDNAIDHNDERTLVICGADGKSSREVATLGAQESPLALWREGKEVLLADYSRDDVNGWIMTLPLARGQRSPLTRGFNVSMVLDDGRLLVERLVAPPPQPEQPINPWDWRFQDPDEANDDVEPPPVASLLDRCVHVIFNPADGSESELCNPSQHARLVCYGESTFFGYQQNQRNLAAGRLPGGRVRTSRAVETFELLIVDSPTQYDLRAPLLNNSYYPLAWLNGRGLLAIEVSNLKTRLCLVDRSSKLNFLTISEFAFDAQGFCASLDGLNVAWLEVEDSNEDGYLDPWRDNCRIWFQQLASK